MLDLGADPLRLCDALGINADVNVGGADAGGVTGDCGDSGIDPGGEIGWVWDFDVHTTDDDLNLAHNPTDDLTDGACTQSPALYERIRGDYWAAGGVFRWATADMFTGSPSWADNHRHQTPGDATINLGDPLRLTEPHAVLARGTVTIQGRLNADPDPAAKTLVVFAGCNIILDTTDGDHFDNVLLVAANSVWSDFAPNNCLSLTPITVTGTIISGKIPFTFSSDTTVTPTACTGSPLQATIPPDWPSKLVAYWPDRPYPWRRS